MRVMVAEDDALHRAFLRATIERMLPECTDIREAADGQAAIALAQKYTPDCVVLDLQMPNTSGAEAAKVIWRNKPDTRILFWSNYADEAYVRGVAKIVPPQAVYGYVLKSASEEHLRFAIRGIFVENQCVIDREIRGVQQRAVDRLQGLTDAEYEILIDIALGLTDRAIAARYHLSPRGVQSRLQHLYVKLGLDPDSLSGGPWGSTFNLRTRAIFFGLARGLLNTNALMREEEKLAAWLRAASAQGQSGKSTRG